MAVPSIPTGTEYIVDAYGCDEATLRDQETFERLAARIVGDLRLRVLGVPVWHVFPGAGGLTGLLLLAESHLCLHTFPEHRYAGINLYCCRTSAEWDWEQVLPEVLGATRVVVREVVRGGASDAGQAQARPTSAAELV